MARTVPPLWSLIGYGHDLSLKTAGLLRLESAALADYAASGDKLPASHGVMLSPCRGACNSVESLSLLSIAGRGRGRVT